MNIESRKRALRYQFEKVVDLLGYKFNPDEELVDFLLQQEVHLEQKHGIPFCPCQGLSKDREGRMKLVCPCIPFHREHFDYMKCCWCLLYVHKDITDSSGLRQIPVTEIPATAFNRGKNVR